MIRTGVFVGSFNPFTIGHDSIVKRALPLFDRLVIGVVGDNIHKPDMPSAEARMEAIRQLYANDEHIEVKSYDGLAIDFATKRFTTKGIRSIITEAPHIAQTPHHQQYILYAVLSFIFSLMSIGAIAIIRNISKKGTI